ncbi:tubulin-specific chaperone D-like [Zootermopsis nevadensis]|uniref:tubulin-specific chaperone D-like n=1 Tax=Zootermopsis nevadensis TaxID=136037 RepID=UPI000B8E6756|nr:tubulin-specific chaperone D-like [Zootermopsis nevadensis]
MEPNQIVGLVQNLGHTDPVIRSLAADSIRTLAATLSMGDADRTVNIVLRLVYVSRTIETLYGGCLMFAELCRNGRLGEHRLNTVVHILLRALECDVSHVPIMAANVRDAACYACWAFAEAYAPNILQPFVEEIAPALMATVVFDRETDCRRAALYALREYNDRGLLPHAFPSLEGLDVTSTSDAFINISVYIAQFEDKALYLINHLMKTKIRHWDIAIRKLAAEALHNLTPLAPEYYTVVYVLYDLLRLTRFTDPNTCHGAVLGIAEVLSALAVRAAQSNRTIRNIVGQIILDRVGRLVPRLRSHQSPLSEQACRYLIERCSADIMEFLNEEIRDEWISLQLLAGAVV